MLVDDVIPDGVMGDYPKELAFQMHCAADRIRVYLTTEGEAVFVNVSMDQIDSKHFAIEGRKQFTPSCDALAEGELRKLIRKVGWDCLQVRRTHNYEEQPIDAA